MENAGQKRTKIMTETYYVGYEIPQENAPSITAIQCIGEHDSSGNASVQAFHVLGVRKLQVGVLLKEVYLLDGTSPKPPPTRSPSRE